MGDEDTPVTKADFNDFMTRMAAMMEEMQSHKAKLEALYGGTFSTTPPALVDASDKGDTLNKEKPLEDDLEKVDEVEGDEDTTKKGDTPRGHNSEIPHPTSYVSGRHLQMSHLASCGPPPPLDASSFANWQDNMRSHINFVSIELWRIIEQGFNPTSKDLNNLLPWEHIDKQLITCHSPRRIRRLFNPSPPPRKLGMLSRTFSLGTQAFKNPNLMKHTMRRTTLR
jgi:hypothetical protein